jgi:PAS domain S-box-containing protein
MEMSRKVATDDTSAPDKNKSREPKIPNAVEETRVSHEVELLLPGGGEMGGRIRSFDWSKTPLGPIQNWSPALLTTVRIVLANRFPILLWWGPEYISIYNDAYIPILGEKHPWALGQPVRECWKEIWHILQPLIDTPFTGGPATWDDDIMLEINRHDFVEETHFTIAYSPVPDGTVPSGIGGVLATVNEITEKVIGERRIVTLRDLAAQVGEARTAEEACFTAAQALTGHDIDIPFALLYLLEEDGRHAHLAGTAGVPINEEFCPPQINLGIRNGSGWPLAQVRMTESIQVVEDLSKRFSTIPSGPWSDPPHRAVVVTIPSNKAHEPAGLMVVGISSRLKLDQLYLDFIELVRNRVATAIANARVYEEERRRAEALAEIDRAKTVFFSNVSHEFRTPLTLMLGPLEDLLVQSNLSGDDRERLELVQRNARRQLKLVNTLLDFSRIEAGRIEASYEPVDLAAYTVDLASVFRSAIENAGLKLIVNCPALDQLIYVDREMWEKIVLNLISNAFKFTFEGEIDVSLRRAGERVELAVRDTGVGIPAEELPHMFDRFHRVRGSQSRTHEGTGIGLALVQELVNLHGGNIEVSSQENIGTTFTVSIPTGTAHLPADRIGAARSQISTALGAEPFVQEAVSWMAEENQSYSIPESNEPGPSGYSASEETQDVRQTASGRPYILLADDNSDMRRYIRRLLVQSNYEVQTVGNGQEALRSTRLRTPDLVLTDAMMPGLDGFSLLRELRADEATRMVPVIILSARAGEEARVEGMEAGADDYLIKPFSGRELLARVGAHVEIARIRRDTERIIRNRSAQFETLLNRAPLGVYLVDADFHLRELNPIAQAVFGNKPNLIGRDFEEVAHMVWGKNYADEFVRIFRHTLETGESFETPEQIEHHIDSQVNEYYEWRLDRIVLPDGRFGVVCYFRDISAQVKARGRLAESEERYRGIVNQSVGAIAEAEPTGRFTTVNDRFCEMTGYSREELMTLRMQDLTHEEDRPHSLKLLEELAAGGASYEIEKRYIRKDGSVIWVHKSASAIRDETGKVKSLIAVLIDITKSKQNEMALQQLNLQLENIIQDRTAELRSTNESLREEIAERLRVEHELGLNHDRLRELSRRLVEVQEEERRAIARELHDRAGQTLSALNINLTIMSDQLSEETRQRIGTRLKESMRLTTDVVGLIRSVVSDLRPMVLYDYGLQAALAAYIREYKVQYGLDVRFIQPQSEIPRLEPGVNMTVLRIMQEALTNVARHARADQVQVSIGLEAETIHLTVQDDGVGITDVLKASRPDSHGLKIMRERAEAYGGSLNVGPAPGRGTRVEAYIPIQNRSITTDY